jgi:hypothetical protein
VIAVDQRIALAALALNYKELATQHHIEDPRLIARDYLAKIIHLPIVLTEPDEASVSNYLEHLWEQTSSPENKATQTQNEEHEAITSFDQSANKKTAAPSDKQNLEENEIIFQKDDILLSIGTSNSQDDEQNSNENSIADKYLPIRIKQIEQLTSQQKIAFKYWLKHFDLSNPRQIKRLHNSYNLLLNFYAVDKEPMKVDSNKIDQNTKEHAFPMMVTLFVFEYLNNLDDMQKRQKLKQLINKESDDLTEKEESYLTDYKITQLVIELANLSLKNTTMIQGIEPFVLPGIDINTRS